MTTAIWPASGQAEPPTLRAVVVATCAPLSTGAAVIHFAVLGEHWREWWGYGLFFAVAAWLQLAWVAVIVTRPSPRLLGAGAVGSLAIAALWVITRTGGVPAGPAFGESESAAFPDVLATAFELLLAGLSAVAVVAAGAGAPTLGRRVGGGAIVAVAVAVVILTTASLIEAASGAGHAEEEGAGPSQDHAAGEP